MRIWLIISHLGVGLLPGPKGTWGAALGVLLFYVAEALWTGRGGWALLILSTLVGTLAAHQAEKVWGEDSGHIIIDEVAGQALTLLFAPLNPFTMILGFFLFRAFDIVKPVPVNFCERIKGGAGVMADDLAAGLYAGVFLWMGWGVWKLFCRGWSIL